MNKGVNLLSFKGCTFICIACKGKDKISDLQFLVSNVGVPFPSKQTFVRELTLIAWSQMNGSQTTVRMPREIQLRVDLPSIIGPHTIVQPQGYPPHIAFSPFKPTVQGLSVP